MPDNAGFLSLSRVIAVADSPNPFRQPLLVCLLASVALHAMLLLWLPNWRISLPSAEVAPVLDVVMAVPERVSDAASVPSLPRAHNAPVLPAAKPQVKPLPPASPAPTVASSPAVEELPAQNVPAAVPAAVAKGPAPPALPPVTVTPPAFSASYLRNPPPAYPAAARRSGEEGTVLLRVLVGRDGEPQKVEVDQSSRSRVLDQAALDAVKAWRFVPARRGTENIEAWVRVPVSFRLES
jgi:periplasmic protein TonB